MEDGGSEKLKNGGGGNDGGGGGNVGSGGGGGGGGGGDMSEALKKCLEENKGDHEKCKLKIEALKSFPKPSSSRRKPLSPLRLRSGSLTDV